MSPNNDAHIFKLIDESNIEKVVFYYFSDGEAKKGLSVHQKVEYMSAQELWKQLKALPKQYNCNYVLDTEIVDSIFEVFNLLSDDKVSNDEMLESINSIPRFRLDTLYETAMNEIKAQKENGPPKDEDEQRRLSREISRIALRNGVLPSALYLYTTKRMKST